MRCFCVQARSHSIMTYNPIVLATKGFYPPYATELVPRRSIFAEEQQLFEANDRHGQYLGV